MSKIILNKYCHTIGEHKNVHRAVNITVDKQFKHSILGQFWLFEMILMDSH